MESRDAETVRRWVEEMWNERRYSLCDELVATDFVEHAHAPFSEDEPGRVDGPETMRASMRWLLGQFPDLSMRIEAIVAHGGLVVVRVLSTGTDLGRLNGVLPERPRLPRRAEPLVPASWTAGSPSTGPRGAT